MGTSAKPCTGSIQEKNGVWYTVIQVTINGRRRSKWETTRLRANGNKRKALAILDERKYQYVQKFMSGRSGNLDRGVDNNILFSFFLQIWIDSQRANVSSITSGSRESMLNSRIRGFFDHRGITLQQLSPADIEGFYNNLRHDGRSGSTLIHYHQFMNQALEAAVRKDILLKNPMKKVDRPKRQQVAGQFYSKQEVEQLLALFENDPLYALIVVAVYYGMRRSELLGLKWCDIDFERNTISVENKVYYDKERGDDRGLVISNQLKTASSRRTLPLVPFVKNTLLQEKAAQRERQLLFKQEYHREYLDMVFVDSVGNLFKPSYVTKHFHTILEGSTIKPLRFHDLRHTCASLLVINGVDMKLVQRWLGHANYSTTADIYSHLDANAQDKTAVAITEILR